MPTGKMRLLKHYSNFSDMSFLTNEVLVGIKHRLHGSKAIP